VYGPVGERDKDGQQNAQGSAGEPGDGYADGQEVSPGKWPEGLGDDGKKPPRFRRAEAAGGNRQRKRGDREVPGEGEPRTDAEHHQQAAIAPRVAAGPGRPRRGRLMHPQQDPASSAQRG
jgi:hypothetical protein